MTFIPRTSTFSEDDFEKIQSEFLGSKLRVKPDKKNTHLFPTDDEALKLKKSGAGLGGYNADTKTIVGLSPKEATEFLKAICKGNSNISPDLLRLHAGIHEAIHFFTRTKNDSSFEKILKQISSQIPEEQFAPQSLSGLKLPRVYSSLYLFRYLNEATSDIAFSIYAAKKYPQDPAIQNYILQMPGLSAYDNAFLNSGNNIHDNSELLQAYQKSIGTPSQPGQKFGRTITMEQAFEEAKKFIGSNISVAVQEATPILNALKLSGLLRVNDYNQLKNLGVVDGNGEYSAAGIQSLGIMDGTAMSGVLGKRRKDVEFAQRLCPTNNPPP